MSPATVRAEASLTASRTEAVLRLAPGTELLGRYQGSGSLEAPFLLRRGDGRMLEVSSLLHLVASALDGRRTLGDVAVVVSAEGGRRITAEQLAYLVEHKLQPLGLIDGSQCDPVPSPSGRPLLGLTLRRAVVPARAVEAATAVLAPLFRPVVVVAVLAVTAAFDIWLVTGPGVGGAMHEVLGTPALLLAMAALTALAGGFHELGHASASRYGGARPGVIGVGVYLLWPVFYNDVNDSYRLSRAGRLRVDLGGVYFNAVLVVVLAAAYGVTGSEALLVAIVLQHVAALQQFLPFLRLDGYYLVSDIAGVPNLFARVRPVLARLVPGRRAAPATSDLEPRARVIVTAWVLAFVPLLAAALVLLVVGLPGFLATAAGAAAVQAQGMARAVARSDPAGFVLSALQLAVYAVPLVGIGVTLTRLVRRLGPRLAAAFDTPGTTWAVGGAVALNLVLAAAAVTGVVSQSPPSEASRPSPPPAAALAAPVPVTAVPVATTTTTLVETPATTVATTAPLSTTATTRPPAPTTTATTQPAPAPPSLPAPAPEPLVAAPQAQAPVARRQPSPAEVQQAIDGFRPYVRSLLPVSPSPEQVVELGDGICTAFDEGQTVEQITATGREMADNVRFATLRPGAEDYILRTGVALYCPGHAAQLA